MHRWRQMGWMRGNSQPVNQQPSQNAEGWTETMLGGLSSPGPRGSVLGTNLFNILINNWDDDSGGIFDGRLQELREQCGMTEIRLEGSQQARTDRVKLERWNLDDRHKILLWGLKIKDGEYLAKKQWKCDFWAMDLSFYLSVPSSMWWR